MTSLARFHSAQQQADAGYDVALAELRGGRKRSHWIWYVFPQLEGLGHSSMATAYAIRGREEAVAYLKDQTLRARLQEITAVVRAQLEEGLALQTLMGSQIDALKLVSSMTLFAEVGKDLATEPAALAVAAQCDAVLDAVAREGYRRCTFTLERLTASA